ncbi:hypothetical protein [Herbiconiux sp. A18JL235]|uniref:Uncharacterized protein n=1 Tax=Herbiconiux sp. A18JL235 TaxID=3152363 RepID=A0AB39BH90_9MICO
MTNPRLAGVVVLPTTSKWRARAAGLVVGVALSVPALVIEAVLLDAFVGGHEAVLEWSLLIAIACATGAGLLGPWLLLRRAPGVARPWATTVVSFAVLVPCVAVVHGVIGAAGAVAYLLSIAVIWSGQLFVTIAPVCAAVGLLLSVAVSVPVVPAVTRSFVRRAERDQVAPLRLRGG